MTGFRVGAWQVTFGAATEFKTPPLLLHQVHGANIIPASKALRQKADGVLVNRTDQPVAIQTADCIPLVMTTKQQALLLHVSRKTLINGILEKVEQLINPMHITGIWQGPHICSKHFTFSWEGEEIIKFAAKYPAAVKRNQAIHIDLSVAVSYHQKKWGIDKQLVQEDHRCTYEDTTLLSCARWRQSGLQGPLPRLLTSAVIDA